MLLPVSYSLACFSVDKQYIWYQRKGVDAGKVNCWLVLTPTDASLRNILFLNRLRYSVAESVVSVVLLATL